MADGGDVGAVGAHARLVLGLRGSEMFKRRARDLDVARDGIWLWVEGDV